MKRIHFFEIEDQAWCPKILRDGVTDFLQHIVCVFKIYQPITQRLVRALTSSSQTNIIDLCSGAAGPWLSIAEELRKQLPGQPITVTLTDLYPNQTAFHLAQSHFPGYVTYRKTPVDATRVPVELSGFRTLFSSFHHLKPEQAQVVLQNAVDANSGIAVFESTQRHPLLVIYMLLTPILVMINTPFIRPFRWSRLFWTYIIPLIPFMVMFDGIVSCLRTYTLEELTILTDKLTGSEYHWEIGLERIGKLPVGVSYLIGYPAGKG